MSLDELMGLTDILKTNGNLCFKINIVFPEGIFLGGVGLIHKKNSKPCENPFFGDCFWRPLTSHIGIWVQLVHCHVWHKTNSQHYHQAYSSRLTLNVLWVRANFIFWWWKICCHWEFKKKKSTGSEIQSKEESRHSLSRGIIFQIYIFLLRGLSGRTGVQFCQRSGLLNWNGDQFFRIYVSLINSSGCMSQRPLGLVSMTSLTGVFHLLFKHHQLRGVLCLTRQPALSLVCPDCHLLPFHVKLK